MIDTVAVVTVITLVVVTITVTAIAIAALQKTKQRVYKGTCHLTTDASITQFDNILRSSIVRFILLDVNNFTININFTKFVYDDTKTR